MKKLISLVVLSFVLLSLSDSGMLWAKKKISVASYLKIGILVNRMTNKIVYSPMPKTTLKTDYGIRQPTNNINVYIDHPKRLSESAPDYPRYTGSSVRLALNYYKNFTPVFTKGIKTWFSGKGFNSVDFRKFAGENGINFSEMTVKAILGVSMDQIDALLILHYMDIGNFYVNTQGVKATNLGLGSVLYSIAMFDVKKQKRLFYYSSMFPLSIENVFFHDDAIMNNPQLKKKLNIELRDEKVYMTHSFTDDELSKQLVHYFINGFKCPKKQLSKLHKKVTCFNFKGLQDYIQ